MADGTKSRLIFSLVNISLVSEMVGGAGSVKVYYLEQMIRSRCCFVRFFSHQLFHRHHHT